MSVKHAVTEPTLAHVREAEKVAKNEDPAWHLVGGDGAGHTVFEHPVYGRARIPNTPRNKGDAVKNFRGILRKRRRESEGHLGAVLQALRHEFDVPPDGFVDVQFNVTERVRTYIQGRPDKHRISEHALLVATTGALTLLDRKGGKRRIYGKNYVGDGSDDKGTPQGTADAEVNGGYSLPDIHDPELADMLKSRRGPTARGLADNRIQNHFEAKADDASMKRVVGTLLALAPGMPPPVVAEYLAVPETDVRRALGEIEDEKKAKDSEPEPIDEWTTEQREALIAAPARLAILEDAGKVPEWVDSALLKNRPTVCPNCGSPGKVRGETPGIESSGIDFDCGNIWDDSATSGFKGRKITQECRNRRDAMVAAKAAKDKVPEARKEGIAMGVALESATRELSAGMVVPVDVIGPLREFFVGDMDAELTRLKALNADLEQRLNYAVDQLQSIRKAAAEAAELAE